MKNNGNGNGNGRIDITIFAEYHVPKGANRGDYWAFITVNGGTRKYLNSIPNKDGSPRFTFRPEYIHSVHAETMKELQSLVGIVLPHQLYDVSFVELEK